MSCCWIPEGNHRVLSQKLASHLPSPLFLEACSRAWWFISMLCVYSYNSFPSPADGGVCKKLCGAWLPAGVKPQHPTWQRSSHPVTCSFTPSRSKERIRRTKSRDKGWDNDSLISETKLHTQAIFFLRELIFYFRSAGRCLDSSWKAELQHAYLGRQVQ